MRDGFVQFLGIDPGPEQSGWCVYETPQVVTRPYVPFGLVLDAGVNENEGLLGIFRRQLNVCALVLEQPVHYRTAIAGKSVLQTMRWAGRFEQQFINQYALPVHWLGRPDVNRELCGSANVPKKAANERLVELHPGGKGKKSDKGPLFGLASHSWDACAVVVAWIMRERTL